MTTFELGRPTSYNIVLVGKTGSGKSATGNTILGRNNIFQTYRQTESGTAYCQFESAPVGDVILNVIDTPGLMDTRKTKEEIQEELLDIMSLCREGFHAFIFTMMSEMKFTPEEVEILNQLKCIFGPTFINCCIIAFTRGDTFEQDDNAILPFSEWLRQQKGEMATLLRDCNNRFLLFYNYTSYRFYEEKRKETVSKLVQLVQDEKLHYTNDHFKEALEIRRKVLIKEKLPQLDAEYQQQLSLIIADLEKGQNLQIVAKRIELLQATFGGKNFKIPIEALIVAFLFIKPELKKELVEVLTEYFKLLKNPPSILRVAIPTLIMAAAAVGGVIATILTAFIPPVAATVAVGTATLVGVNATASGVNINMRKNYKQKLRLWEDKIKKLIMANTSSKND